jgi:hypothetical protein
MDQQIVISLYLTRLLSILLIVLSKALPRCQGISQQGSRLLTGVLGTPGLD